MDNRPKWLFKVLSCLVLVALANESWACTREAVDANWMVEGRALLFPAASDSQRQGFVRVINRSNGDGVVRVHPVDDSGWQHDALTLAIDANATVHFNSEDLEAGNSDKGLTGAAGQGEGNWRLDFGSELDIEVVSYIRHRDGFLTAMNDIAFPDEDGCEVAIFNPASNWRQASVLRLVNLGQEDAAVTIGGVDDQGSPGLGEVALRIDAGAARAITAQELESGGGMLEGRLGDGFGKWRLIVESDQPVVAMSLMESPTGHLTNLSAAPAPEVGGVRRVPLFPAAGDASGRQGFVRVINRSPDSGQVRIQAYDETGSAYQPVTLSIGGNEAVHFNSDDLEQGGVKGLSAGTGSGTGDWRLDIDSDLDITALAYIRTQDGFLTSMHDAVPNTGNAHRAITLNPASNWRQVSRLRLANLGDASATVSIQGIDDRGESPGDVVELVVPAGGARELDAAELEAGTDADGALGDGLGKWRLIVESVEPLLVMSLMESPTGHLTNLSTAAPRWDPLLVEDHFVETTTGPVDGVEVAVVDAQGFEPGQHGQRVADIFAANTNVASLTKIDGWGSYQHRGVVMMGLNETGYIRQALRNGAGVFFTSSDTSPSYRPNRSGWLFIGDRPFYARAQALALWMRDENVLFVSSLENSSGLPADGDGFDPHYCDDFDAGIDWAGDEFGWIPLCGAVDDYIAHTGVAIERVVFVGAVRRWPDGAEYASAAIRSDGAFAPHAIYVESADGSTSQATPVLAAYATNLAFANPKWGAARLKRELMKLAREEEMDYATGESNASGNDILERRTIKVIRPDFAPTGATQ